MVAQPVRTLLDVLKLLPVASWARLIPEILLICLQCELEALQEAWHFWSRKEQKPFVPPKADLACAGRPRGRQDAHRSRNG